AVATTPATTSKSHIPGHAYQPAEELLIIFVSTLPFYVLHKQAQLPQGLDMFSVEELSPITPKIVWDPLHNHGNPTKSTEVNDLISFVKKKETRGQGKKSQADRPFKHSEFKQVLDTCQASLEADFDP
ncbi:hypothetical protein ACHAWO_013503, partial [Cyclotella atomus]